jgi:hypothetical protein
MAPQSQRLISKPTLAVIKRSLASLCTHSEMANLFEQYEFDCGRTVDYSNKVERAGTHLDHHDWSKPEVAKRLCDLLTHVVVGRRSRGLFHSLETSHAWREIVNALGDREGIEWDGNQFTTRKSAALIHVAEKVQQFDIDSVHREVERLLANVETDPADVLTSAKSLIESVCRAILADLGQQPGSNTPEFSQLARQTFGQLRLLPDQVSNQSKGAEVVKRILQNIGSVLQGLAELRNLYGDAHGRGPGSKGLEARHARLAAGIAGSLATFLLETHEKRSAKA